MTIDRPSILHVTQTTIGGVETYVGDIVRDQTDRGWSVALACPPSSLGRQAAVVGARHLMWEAKRSAGPTSLLEARALGRIVDVRVPDLIHLHSSKAGLAGRLAVRGRIPTVFQPHGWSFEVVTGVERAAAIAWERLGARWTDHLVCVSEGECLLGERVRIRADRTVIPNGVDLERHRPASDDDRRGAREELDLPAGPLAVCIGRLSRAKGQDLLLAAWPVVSQRVAGARLVLVGEGPLEEELAASAPAGVTFAGLRDDVDRWLAAADVVVLPSRSEGHSLVMLEAMAAARSVVITDVAGARETVTDDSGALIPAGKPGELVEAICARLLDRSLASREGAKGRARVEARFDQKDAFDAIADLYLRIMPRPSGKTPPN